jgi:hypothetical protein
MAALVTLAAAKAHLRIDTPDGDPGDVALQTKLDQASALVLDRCNATAWFRAITPTWTVETVPAGVQAAIDTMVTHLWEHRGDDMAPDADVWAAVDRQIGANRGPVLV